MLHSFVHAFRGVKTVFREERNFRIQILAGTLVISSSFILSLSVMEKSVLALLVIIVLSLEMLNSILERFVDVLKPRVHSYVKDVKDIAAGAVLISSLGAVAVGIIIFYPHVFNFIVVISGI